MTADVDLTTCPETDLLYYVQLIVSKPTVGLTREDRRDLARIGREFARREKAGKLARRREHGQVSRTAARIAREIGPE